MKARIAMLLIAACVSFNCFADSRVLWRDLPAGATVDQVKKFLPEVKTLDKPVTWPNRTEQGLLQLTGFEIENLEFKATLFFDGGKLGKIFLNPVEDPAGSAARAAASNIKSSLMAKYGVPVSVEGGRTIWSENGVEILFMFDQYSNDGTGFIQVNYKASVDVSNL